MRTLTKFADHEKLGPSGVKVQRSFASIAVAIVVLHEEKIAPI